MIVGCYSTDLYCDFPDLSYAHMGCGSSGPGFAQFTGRTFSSTKRQAIKQGWRFHNDGDRVLCPWCIKQGRKLPAKGTTP